MLMHLISFFSQYGSSAMAFDSRSATSPKLREKPWHLPSTYSLACSMKCVQLFHLCASLLHCYLILDLLSFLFDRFCRLFVTFNPFSVHVTQGNVKPGYAIYAHYYFYYYYYSYAFVCVCLGVYLHMSHALITFSTNLYGPAASIRPSS